MSESRRKNYIFKVVETLYGTPWEQKKKERNIIHINEYRWNFSFQLPKDIPPTVIFKKGKSKIAYIMKAHVKVPKRRSIKYIEEVIVGTLYKYDPSISPIHSNEQTAPFTSKHKKLRLTVMAKRNVSFSHDDFGLELHIDNGLPQKLKCVDIKIIRFLKSGDYVEKKTIARYKTVDEFPIKASDVYNKVLTIKMPPNMLPTCIGKMVLITYHLKIIIPINSFKRAKLSMPLIISSYIEEHIGSESFQVDDIKRINSQEIPNQMPHIEQQYFQVEHINSKPEVVYYEQGLFKKMSQIIHNQ